MPADATNELSSLLERMKAGDPEARDVFIERCQPRLRRLTLKIAQDFKSLNGFEEPGDVLQNATLRLLRCLKRKTPDSVEEFFQLAALAIRCELIDLRHHHFGPHGDAARHFAGGGHFGEIAAAAIAAAADAGDDPADLSAWTRFHELIESLPVEQRVVVDLFWYHGMSYRKAAKVLHCSTATIKRRWRAARQSLQTFLLGNSPFQTNR